MADASDSPDTRPEPTTAARSESASEAPSGRMQAAKNRSRSPALSPPIRVRDRLTKDLGASLRVHEAEVTRALP